MFQKFFTDTLSSRFIKNLLRNSPLPLLKFAQPGKPIIKGCSYIFKSYIIHCEETGYFVYDKNDVLYPSDMIYPTRLLFPNLGYLTGKYKVVKLYDPEDLQTHYRYHSRYMYYDADTHYYLGEYLRNYRELTGINLLPYYNCYNTRLIKIDSLMKPGKNTSLIPIKFDSKYTLALESATPVTYSIILYDQDLGDISNNYSLYTSEFEIPNMRFHSPILIESPSALDNKGDLSSLNRLSQEKNLYLKLDIDTSIKTSIVILEGDYRNHSSHYNINVGSDFIPKSFHNLSLLQYNTGEIAAFSDRLIEYLINNIISNQDIIHENVSRIQTALHNNRIDNAIANNSSHNGIWDNLLEDVLNRAIDNYRKTHYLIDQDGNINKDIEQLIMKGLLK